MKKIVYTLFFIIVSSNSLLCQVFVISGMIRDRATHEPLVAASIRIAGSTKGSISNSQGNYRVSLEQGDYDLVFSYIGYRTDSVHVTLDHNIDKIVELEASPIQMAEVVVTGEDPAMGIMRKVIENKRKWIEKLRSYELEAFTRQVLRRDTTIAVITESYSTCYWQTGDTLREIIRQKRQTENIKGAQNFASVGGIVNFYDDEIRFSGFKFIGPTAPNAFEYYDYKLERTRQQKGSDVYDITMIPKSRLVPLFAGTISIVEGTYALVGITVTPNEAFIIPFVTDIKLTYAQQFSLIDNQYWMPADIRINGFIQIGLTGLTFPGIGFEAISSIYDCKVNTEIPDSIFRKPRRMELKDAAKFDSLFWAQRDVLPLTEEEKTAYQKLDSTQSVEKQFTPSGPLVAVSNFLGKSPVAPQMRFNRAEGLFVGVSANFDSVTSQVAIRPEIGYGVSDEKPKGRLVLEYYFDRHRDYSFTFEGYQDISHFFGGEFHTDFSNVFSSLFYKIDYFDYYYTRGFAVTSSGRLLRDLVLTGSYRNEKQFLAIQRSNYSFFYRKNIYRVNPPIEEGVYRGIETKLRYGQDPAPVPIIPVNFVETQIVYSSSALGSAFNYTQILAKGEYHLATFFRSSLFPPSLMAKFSAGASFGTLTPQRYYTFDSPLLGFAPNGVLRGAGIKEFSGDTYYVLTVEQNFRSIPFLMLNIPFLYKNSIELLTFATVAQSWSSEAFVPSFIHATKGIYAEAGISIGRLLGLFRLDYTYRITRPDRSVITVGISSLL